MRAAMTVCLAVPLAIAVACEAWPSAQFLSLSPAPGLGQVVVKIREAEAEVLLQGRGQRHPVPSVIVPRVVKGVWFGWSRDGEALSILLCAEADFPTQVERVTLSDARERTELLTPAFTESDAQLIRSLRSTFSLSEQKSDRAVIEWFCHGPGITVFKERFWPKGHGPSQLPFAFAQTNR